MAESVACVAETPRLSVGTRAGSCFFPQAMQLANLYKCT